MIRKLVHQEKATALEILNIQRKAYEVEAQLINFFEIPPLLESLTDLMEVDEVFYGYFLEQTLAGVIALKHMEKVIDIHRLFVAPTHFRQGIATQLLQFAQTLRGEKIVVSAAAKNVPAVQLYDKQGFEIVGQQHITDELMMVHFEKGLG